MGKDDEERVELNNGVFREEETEVPTNDEQPLDLKNDDPMNQTTPAGAISGLDDSVIGDSSQYRMKKDELGLNEPEEEPYNDILDNTGLNMKPDSAVNDDGNDIPEPEEFDNKPVENDKEENKFKKAKEEVSGPPAGTTIHANSLDKEREEPDVLPDGKVVEPLKWKTKKGENKKNKKKRKKRR
jgi:hypothetical protein